MRKKSVVSGNRKIWKTEKEKMKSMLVQHLSYPRAPNMKDKEHRYARFLDIFNRLKINISFTEALKYMPKYAKFMK